LGRIKVLVITIKQNILKFKELLLIIKLSSLAVVFLFVSCNSYTNLDNSISEIISIDTEHIYYENFGGFIIKKNSTTNKEIWKHKKLYNLSIKVFNSGNSIYYTTPSEVVSINKINGEVNFIVKENFSIRTSDFISYNKEIIASSTYGVYSFSNLTGEILWSLLPSSSTILTDSKILINEDILFVAGKFKSNSKSDLYSYNLKDKSKINEISLTKEIITNIALFEDNLIFGTGQSIMEREIFSINKDSFKIKWQLKQNIDHSSKIVLDKKNSAFFNFNNQVFQLNINSLEVKQRFELPNNYFKLFDINNNQLICYNNSSLVLNSLSNSEKKYFKNIMTNGPWEFNHEIYFIDKNIIKKLTELE
jgi:hypothetical protein